MKKIYNSFARTVFSLALAVVCAVNANAEAIVDPQENVNPYLKGDKVPYVDKDGVTKYVDKSEVKVLTGDETVLTSGWYTTNERVIFTHDVKIQGTVNLLLKRREGSWDEKDRIEIAFRPSEDASLEHAAIYGETDNDSLCLYSFDGLYTMAQEKYKTSELNFESSTKKKFMDVAHFVGCGPSVDIECNDEDAEVVNVKTLTMYDGYFSFDKTKIVANTVNMYGGCIISSQENYNAYFEFSKINFYSGHADLSNLYNIKIVCADESQEIVFPENNVTMTMDGFSDNITRIDNKITMKEFIEYVGKGQLSSFNPIKMADDKDWSKKFYGYLLQDVVLKFVGRTFAAGCYNTFSVPALCEWNFLDEAFGKGNWTLKRLSDAGVNDETLTLNFIDAHEEDDGVYPNVPYLLKVEKEVKEPILFCYGFSEDVCSMMSEQIPSSFNGVSFLPTTYSPVTVGEKGDDIESMLFLGANNTLYHPTSMPATIKAFRAYFLLEEPVYTAAKRIALNVDGKATSISELADDSFDGLSETGEWYSLQGAKLGGKPSVAGIYIHNGKKVAIQK